MDLTFQLPFKMASMKKLSTYFLALALLWGCNLEEINENPNVPVDAPLSTLLPPAQKGIATSQAGRLFRYTGIFSKQMRGVEAEELRAQNYQPDELFVSNPWQDLYVGPMINLKIIIERSSLTSPHYAGVARVLMAQCLGILADVWGDVPYSEALRGGEIDHPRFDNQEEIYAAIFQLLDQAIDDLQQANSVFTPGSDDLMYSGNLNQWIAAASAMRARYAMHTTKRNAAAYVDALQYLNESAMNGVFDDLKYSFLGTGDEINPIAGIYNISPLAFVNPFYTGLLNGLNDPRASTITRAVPLSGGNRRPGDYFAAPAAAVRLMSYVEQEFIRAEAQLRAGEMGEAQAALERAVRASMNEVSAGAISQEAADDYVNTQLQLDGGFEDNLRKIITQKYIALLTTPEPWTDWRRTGYPELQPNPVGPTSANPTGEIPRRLIYPQSERLRNNNFPSPAPNMQTRFWWDID